MEGRKRGRSDGFFNGNGGGGFKKNRQEMDSFQPGLGSKSKPCMKFFNTTGCPFGEGCHFLHYVPDGINAVAQMTNLGGNHSHPPASRNAMGPPSIPNGSLHRSQDPRCATKSKAPLGPSHEDPRAMGLMSRRFPCRVEPPHWPHRRCEVLVPWQPPRSAWMPRLRGAIIGKSGVNSKQICRVTGAKLSIRDHESDPNLRNIELEGNFDQIKQASSMVRDLIVNIGSTMGHGMMAMVIPLVVPIMALLQTTSRQSCVRTYSFTVTSHFLITLGLSFPIFIASCTSHPLEGIVKRSSIPNEIDAKKSLLWKPRVQCLVSIGAVSARDGKKHRSAPQSGRVCLVFVAPYCWRQLYSPLTEVIDYPLLSPTAKGSCTFGDRCHFAHGQNDLRKSAV
ncbi:hypothetical protein IFM89_010504 [Coptis chinensis]|uniref:C3H1-type domain-containing protein n=1 Tax=Coptis chinensis TaxID=261450 RepID=A0A835H0G7_9MAGN|nr:hypothetical protein IFM89_010504 [Coptis chinensis]